MFKSMAGIDIVHVPYKGDAPEVTVYYPRWGVELFNLGTKEMPARYLADIVKYSKVIRDAKIPQVD